MRVTSSPTLRGGIRLPLIETTLQAVLTIARGLVAPVCGEFSLY